MSGYRYISEVCHYYRFVSRNLSIDVFLREDVQYLSGNFTICVAISFIELNRIVMIMPF